MNIDAPLGEIRPIVERYFRGLESAEQWSAPGRIPLSVPLYGAEETLAIVQCMLSQSVTMGEAVKRFEGEFAEYVGAKHAIMVNSGSSANLLIMTALSYSGLGATDLPVPLSPGDEIVVPAVTWATSIWPIVQLGCVPVFVDTDPRTLNMDPAQVERAISSRTRAVFPTHLLGNPAQMDRLSEIAQRHRLWLLEDCCESLGSAYGEKMTGSIGHMGSYSFYFSHHITTIEGGMVVTSSDELADLSRSMRAHGWVRDLSTREQHVRANPGIDPRFLFAHLGYNIRPTDLQGAMGSIQLKKLESFNEDRRRNAARLNAAIKPFGDWFWNVGEQAKAHHTWFGFPMILSEKAPFTRKQLVDHLESGGIDTRPIVAGNIAKQPALRGVRFRQVGSLPNANEVHERGLFIGNHPRMSDETLGYVVDRLVSFLKEL